MVLRYDNANQLTTVTQTVAGSVVLTATAPATPAAGSKVTTLTTVTGTIADDGNLLALRLEHGPRR